MRKFLSIVLAIVVCLCATAAMGGPLSLFGGGCKGGACQIQAQPMIEVQVEAVVKAPAKVEVGKSPDNRTKADKQEAAPVQPVRKFFRIFRRF